MKIKYLLTLLSALLLSFAANAQTTTGTVSLAWTASADTRVNEYKVYYSTTPGGPYLSSVVVAPIPPATTVPTTVTVTGLTDGQVYYFVATALDTTDSLESIFSLEVNTKIPFVPLPQVTGLKVTATSAK